MAVKHKPVPQLYESYSPRLSNGKLGPTIFIGITFVVASPICFLVFVVRVFPFSPYLRWSKVTYVAYVKFWVKWKNL